jgi:tetratricopeptide (TPR) repeat protein
LVASLAELGVFDEGIAYSEEEVRLADSVDQPYSTVHASFAAGFLYLRKGDILKAITALERGLELCQVWNLGGWLGNFTAHLGYACALFGHVAEAVHMLEQAVKPSVSPSYGMGALWMAYLSEAYLLAGRRDVALQLAERALAPSAQHYSRGQEAWLLRILGDIHAQSAPQEVDLAEASYCQALALAEKLEMRPLQAHCHLSLGTLHAQTGQREQASTALSAAIALYSTMDMTFWLPQAEAALAQIGEERQT